jgi:hypothetical protein
LKIFLQSVNSQNNTRLKGMTQEQYDESEQLRLAFEETLKAAMECI